jgi:hypothetical protein
MKNMFLGLVFVALTFSACGGAGAPNNFSGALELPPGKEFNQALAIDVGACFLDNGVCADGNANNKIVTINAKQGDTKVPFSITDLKSGNYYILVLDGQRNAIGGLIDGSEKPIMISPPKSGVKIIIAPSQLQSVVVQQKFLSNIGMLERKLLSG